MRGLATNRFARLLLLALAWGLLCSAGRAGTATSVTLPTGSGRPTFGGLTITLAADWVQNFGHLPVRASVHSVARKQDVPLRLEIATGDWYTGLYVVTSTDLVLPAGETRVEQMVLVPQTANSQHLNLTTYVDGRKIDELSVENYAIGSGQYWGGDASVPRILFVGDKVPNVTKLSFLGRPPYLSYGNNISFTRIQDVFAFVHRRPDQLFDDWLFYDALDIIVLSLDDAQKLAKTQAEKWRAIEYWNRCGGTLCIYGAAQDWSGLASVEKLVHAPANAKEAELPYRGWEAPSTVVFEETVVPAIADAWHTEVAVAEQEGNSGTVGPQPKPPATPDKPPFVWKGAGFGTVVALASNQPFPGEDSQWRWLLESLDDRNTNWSQRYGSVPNGENPQFNEFLIGDVGLPPIRTYRVLITIFVVAIGPLNYWLLRRSGRLHLFLFTVPLAALLTGAGLLSYALLSDGLVSRVRVRSLTQLDQPSGRMASTARLSYYVGLAPSEGLTFSDNTLVVPLELEPAEAGDRRRRDLVWNDNQHLSRGWIVSRTPLQYVTARGQRSTAGLDILPAADGKKLAIKNRLGTRIQHLVVCDESGIWHHGSDIARDASAQLDSAASVEERDDAAKRLLAATRAFSPGLPNDMTAFGAHENWFLFGRRYNYYGNISIDPTQSILEDGYSKLQAMIRAQALPARSYVAVVERPEHVETGMPGLVETQSVHVIQGTW